MKIHVLPGDAQAEVFGRTGIEGEVVICRECLVEGAVEAENLDQFWAARADFIKKIYGGSRAEYFEKVVREFEKLDELPVGAEVNLWFEYELFCQANMWFCLSLLKNSQAAIYRVAPIVRTREEIWQGFGGLNETQMQNCLEKRAKFSRAEVLLGAELWEAYRTRDHRKLAELSKIESDCFPHLEEVCRAEIEKSFKPRAVLAEIMENGEKDFGEIFPEFSRLAGVYGFGDAQVKRILGQV